MSPRDFFFVSAGPASKSVASQSATAGPKILFVYGSPAFSGAAIAMSPSMPLGPVQALQVPE